MSATRDPTWEALRIQAKSANIVEVARQMGARLKPNNRYLAGACPRGCATIDGFIIDPRRKTFFCRPSGEKGGDIIAMTMHTRDCGYREAIAFIVGQPSATPSILATPPARRRTEEEEAREEKVMRPRAPTTTADAMKLWTPAVDPRGTLGEVYLNRNRALSLDDDLAGQAIRWHPGLNALLALFRSIATGEAQSVLRIVLDREGHLIKPRMFTGPAGGAAAMLDAFEEITTGLHVGEGVETCMAGRQYDLKPTWALGSTVAIAKFAPLAGVECLTLLQENDGGKSECACTACAGLWRAAGRQVIRNIPRPDCKDLNDVLMSERA
jgi:hypothetical protein